MCSGICGSTASEDGLHKQPSEAGTSGYKPVKSFASYKKMKGKEWKSRVSKTGQEEKKKAQDVVINVGLMEWNEKEQVLKAKRGKKLPLRVSATVSYNVLRNQAEEKWKNFHSNLYDEGQSYNLLYEDGSKALFLPGPKKELFTLSRYQEEVGKDFKRITLYLCSNCDFEISEGYLDEELSDFGKDGDNVLQNATEVEKPAKRARCRSAIDLMTDPGQSVSQIEIDHQLASQSTNQSNNDHQLASQSVNQVEMDRQLASQIQEMYNNESSGELQNTQEHGINGTHKEDTSSEVVDSSSVVPALAQMVDENGRLFIVVRRGSPLNRVLSIWNREMKKNVASAHPVVRVHFSGEEGIDSGAMAKEFFTSTLPNIGSVMFPEGKPLESTFHVQNGNFKACGQVVASSLAQGGPAPHFLDESVYSLLVNPSVPVHELDPQKHLTPSDRLLLNSVRTDLTSHADTVIEHGYTGRIDDSHMEEIVKSIVISIVTKRVVYLKEFLEGLDAYSLGSIIQTHPEACKALFIKDAQNDDEVDANFLFSTLHPVYSPNGSTRREIEESMMDFLQDFLFRMEDEPSGNVTGYAEAIASSDTDDLTTHTNTEVAETNEQFHSADCSPTGVMGWLTGQKHKPINGEQIRITVKFNHDCTTDNPNHRICFPIVGACAKEITFPVAHMKTADEFSEVLMIALSKGQSFGKA